MNIILKAGCILAGAFALSTSAADYYVGGDNASDDNDGSASAPFATLDKAFATGGGTKGNNIYVRAGTYSTNQQYGYDLKANLIGDAETRDEVVIQSAGNYRTLRMNATDKPTVTKVTIVGCTDISKVDKGGAIEMNGGTLRDCVIRDGKTYGNSSNLDGGNIYMAGDSLVEDCLITGGEATKRGGNVYLDNGTIRNCTITDGTSRNVGGNVFQYKGTIENCVISNGTSVNDGGNVRLNGAGTIRGTLIKDGTNTANDKKGANVYMDNGTLSRCHLQGGANAAYNAGSLCVYNSTDPNVEDCLIEGSSVGGVLLGSTSRLYNTTIVNNAKYGVWSWTANQTLVNCVIFNNFDGTNRKEWTGNQATHSQAVFLNNATAEGALSKTTFPTLVAVTEADFTDFAKGDYHQTVHAALVDAGMSDPRGAAAGTQDLDGNPRTSGTIDIGCYEYQKQDMTVRIDGADYTTAWAPATVTFAHSTENSASPENVVYAYDFGDGSEPQTTTALTISHAYANPGIYTVKITATNDCEEEKAEMTYDGYVRVASSTVYVTAGNKNEAFPYDTPETGYSTFRKAVNAASDGYTILLGAGVYEDIDQYSITKALTIKGLGVTPEEVVLRNTAESPNTYYHRTLEINNAATWVSNLTLENGKVKDQTGANLRLVTGVVSNCVIRGGYALVGTGSAAGAGVELAGAGTLTHCVITNNVVEGTSSNAGYTGGAVFVTYLSKNGRVNNCLIAGNRYITTGDVKDGAAGVHFGGSNDNTQIENNTIVANVVEGSLKDDSAGVHCTTWYGRLRNNIIAGNYETGKEKYTSVKVDSGHCTFDNNLTDDETAYTARSFAAPLATIFRNFANGDYTLRPTSPACNKGTTTGLVLRPAVDLLGNPREFGKAIDIGCYECQSLPGLAITVK